MPPVVVWLIYFVAVMVAVVFVWAALQYYSRHRDSCLPAVVSWVGVSTAVALFMLVPVDVYLVSNGLSDIICQGTLPADEILDQINGRMHPPKYLYMGLWSVSASIAFVPMPFVYFYHEEGVSFGFEASHLGSNTGAAVKYVLLFLAMAAAVACAGIFVEPGATLDDLAAGGAISVQLEQNWTRAVNGGLNRAFNFLLVGTGCVGLLGWAGYTAVGLASLPVHMITGGRHTNDVRAAIAQRESLLSDRYYQIREKARRYGVDSLTRRERRDAEVTEHTRLNLNDDRTRLDGRQTAVAYCMDACPCVRWVIGFLFLIVTMLILEAAVVTAADAAIRNTGLQYGFVLRNSRLGQFNLLNLLLRLGCQQDVACSDQQTLIGTIATFAAVSFLALYLVTCTLYGMVITGSCGAFRLKAHRTTQQSIIACSFVLIFVLYGASLALPALAPQFFYYGCQHNCQCEGAEPVANTVLCSDEAVGAEDLEGYFCTRTILSLASSFMRLSLAPVGIFVFAMAWLHVLMTLTGGGLALCKTRASNIDELDTDDMS